MIAGSSTLGSGLPAIQEAGPASDAVIVACGGGGLASGVALALRSHSIDATIYVAEPETHRRYAAARAAGAPVRIEPSGDTICDALNRARSVGRRSRSSNSLQSDYARSATLRSAARATSVGHLQDQGRAQRRSGNGDVLNGSIALESTRLWVIACGGNVDPSVDKARRA